MITTSTDHIDGYQVSSYLGMLTASSVFGKKRKFSDIQGKEDFIDEIYQETLRELSERASFLGGDALIGIRSTVITPYPGIAYLQLSGTVVQLKAIKS